ncbi:DUF1844 domain-containing protein [Granulicella sp. dw_53]|uniref:DUF1844 domain-containing protein n=1 Tax=Granulicella sp. dw_53 TaxID=2719792 RepID=UPI001BD5DC2E|nr:DUF1844 domain-containing protein [Granulicella sp. dw_53]
MPEQNKPFVVTDRRKFTLDGEPRPDADPSPAREPRDVTPEPAPTPVPEPQQAAAPSPSDEDIPAGPTAEQSDQARIAYDATADRLDTAIRAANPGMDRLPPMSFEQLVQSVYMSAVMQLGGSTPEGQQPQVDLMGARQSIDMLSILQEKTKGNLATDEDRLLDSALFELRMAFLEITQALARSAAAKNPGQGPLRPGPVGPSIVR